METKLTIGERLKDLRVERDLNQKVVESQAGIPSSTLSTYENDTVGNVNVAAIIKLAEFYDVQPEYLLCRIAHILICHCLLHGFFQCHHTW